MAMKVGDEVRISTRPQYMHQKSFRGKLIFIFKAKTPPFISDVEQYYGASAPEDAYAICHNDRYVLQLTGRPNCVVIIEDGIRWEYEKYD